MNQPEHHVLDGGEFEAVLDSVDEGIVTLDDHGNVIGINTAACQLLEISKAEALKHGCPCLLGRGDLRPRLPAERVDPGAAPDQLR